MQASFIPVMLGGDLNCYGMARSFFEAYGIPSVAFGKQSLGPTRFSRYLRHISVPNLSDFSVCRRVLLDFYKKEKGKTLLLFACTDEYARLLIEHRDALSPYFALSVPPPRALRLSEKDVFYRTCADYEIATPDTVVYRGIPSRARLAEAARLLGYPHILKPAESHLYWQYPFPEMEKVYLVHSPREEEDVLSRIRRAGYPGAMLAQRYIGGDRVRAFVLTLYFDRNGRAVLRACGRALLEEMTPCGKGNYAALLTAPIPPVAERIVRMLTDFCYRGFANLDIRRDARGRDFVLELNLRQGRSNYFLTAAGVNPAEVVVRDVVEQMDLAPTVVTENVLVRTVPLSTVCRHTARDRDAVLCKRLHRAGRDVSLLHPTADLFLNPLRRVYVWEHMRREAQKFRRFSEMKR